MNDDFQSIDKVLSNLCQNKNIITLTLSNGEEISGKIASIASDQITFQRRNSFFELDELPVIIKMDKIVSIAVNDEADIIFQKWLDSDQVPDSGICAFYPMYSGDERFTNYLAGKILAENDDYFLVQAVDDVGQLNAVTVIDKDHIAHVSEESDELDYLNFAVNEQKKNDAFDPFNLMKKINPAIIESKDMKQIILDYPDDRLLSVDDVNFDGQDLGYLSQKDVDSFTMQVVNEYSVDRSIQFNYDDIVSVDLTSFEIEILSSFLL